MSVMVGQGKKRKGKSTALLFWPRERKEEARVSWPPSPGKKREFFQVADTLKKEKGGRRS